jgi:TorA maturation chaperone TorD
MPATDDRPDDDTAADAAGSPDEPGAAAMASARARVYGLLAATFDGDTARLARALEQGAFVDLAEVLPVSIDTAALASDAPDERALELGYDNLFVVPGAHYVPPFASAHATEPSEEFESDSPYHTAGEAGELLGDPAADAVQLYDTVGFEPARGDDIPDHLAAYFEFMRALCECEAALLAEEDPDAAGLETVWRLQAAALSQLGWLDRFERAVAAEDSVEGVFATLARIARTFTAWDAREGGRATAATRDESP